jgi:spore coat protein A
MDRRQFLKTSAGAAALLTIAHEKAYGYAVSMRLPKFVQPLPMFGTDIPIMTPDQTTYPGIDYYEVEAGVYRQQLHPSLPNPTRLYGYRQVNMGGAAFCHLGGAVVARRNRPVRLKFTCNLPLQHILPYDPTIPQGPMGTPTREHAAAIHLHGGLVPWTSDGGPFHWIAKDGNQGSALPANGWLPDNAGTLTNEYFYPNNQSARFMWYHDHAVGITRTNAYAGLATGYFILDPVELGLGLPVPGDILVFQDKVFWDPLIDPGYGAVVNGLPAELGPAVAGDLWYPYIYDPKIWKLKPRGLPLPAESCVAEVFGDTMLVNGVVHPYQEVNGMKRYRLLNACNARFLNLSFALEHKTLAGEPQITNKGLPVWAPVKVWQIGTEGGFLPTPILLADGTVPGAAVNPLLLAPAERADIVVDFSAVPVGTNVILFNDAQAPFPAGNPIFNYSVSAGSAKPGLSPNTQTLLQFRRTAAAGTTFSTPSAITAPVLPTVADALNGGLKLNLTPGVVTFNGGLYNYLDPNALGNTQELTLNEAFDAYGRLTQIIGNLANPNGRFGSPYVDGMGETAAYGTIQIWNIYNLTADTHPMHFHLFNVMILRRRPFKVNNFNGVPSFTAIGVGPTPGELGWKETVRMNPGECTTIAVLVEDPFVLSDPGTGVHGSTSAVRTYTFNVSSSQNEATAAAAVTGGVQLTVASTTGYAVGDRVYTSGIGSVADGFYSVVSLDQTNLVINATLGTGAFRAKGIVEKVTPASASVPHSPRLANLAPPVTGDEYVWHCHILEHEEHDMMHSLVGQ